MDNKEVINTTDFPSNSHTKTLVSKPEERKPVEKIITGTAVKQKKTMGRRAAEMFLGETGEMVKDHIVHDVLIPAAKSMICDVIGWGGFAEMLLFGEKKGRNTTREGGKSYTSYSAYYKTDKDRDKRPSREISNTSRARHNFDEIVLDTRGDAEEVLSQMVDLTIDYDRASVADLYDLVGITSNFTDHKYGWTDLRNASVSRVKGGYLINLPRTQMLD